MILEGKLGALSQKAGAELQIVSQITKQLCERTSKHSSTDSSPIHRCSPLHHCLHASNDSPSTHCVSLCVFFSTSNPPSSPYTYFYHSTPPLYAPNLLHPPITPLAVSIVSPPPSNLGTQKGAALNCPQLCLDSNWCWVLLGSKSLPAAPLRCSSDGMRQKRIICVFRSSILFQALECSLFSPESERMGEEIREGRIRIHPKLKCLICWSSDSCSPSPPLWLFSSVYFSSFCIYGI